MESKEELFEQIETYLAGRMPDREKIDFEAQMEEDPELTREVQLHADLARGLNEPDMEQLRATIQKVIRSQGRPTIPFIRQYHRHLIAACIILILGVIAMVQFTHQPTPQQLFAQYFEPYPDVLTSRDDTDLEPRLLEAMALYNRQEYDLASPLFEQIVEAGNATELVYLYYGVNELARGEGERALELLNSAESHTILEYDFKWYLVLTQLKMGNEEQAKAELTGLTKTKFKYSGKAQKLLDQLTK